MNAPTRQQRFRLGIGGAKALTTTGTIGMFHCGVMNDSGATSAIIIER
jgi:hypothetical protein